MPSAISLTGVELDTPVAPVFVEWNVRNVPRLGGAAAPLTRSGNTVRRARLGPVAYPPIRARRVRGQNWK